MASPWAELTGGAPTTDWARHDSTTGSCRVAGGLGSAPRRPTLPERPDPPSRGVRARFVAGVVVLWVAVDWPMDRLGDDYLFSAHMAQFVLVTMVAAPLLVSGIPTWLQVELVRPGARVVRFLGRGPVALGFFQVVLVATHLRQTRKGARATVRDHLIAST